MNKSPSSQHGSMQPSLRTESTLEEAKITAAEAAKVLIERKFKETANLEDIHDMRAEYRRKLAATESQLSTVVRARLDGVKRARDLIEDSAAKIEDLHAEFAKMEVLSRDCRGLFQGRYPHIKTLHYARSNLAMTSQLVEFFFSIPALAKHLREVLDQQPHVIKKVFTESLTMTAWSDSFMQALKEYGDNASRRATFGRSREGADAEKHQKIVQRAGPQLAAVNELDLAIRERIINTVAGQVDERGSTGGCLGLAMTDPTLLVRTLEVAELLHMQQKRRYEAARASAAAAMRLADQEGMLMSGSGMDGMDGPDPLAEHTDNSEDFRRELLDHLTRRLEEKLGAQFAYLQMSAVDAGKTQMIATLDAATNMCTDMANMETYVVPCFPPAYSIHTVFRGVYRKFLQDLLLPLVTSEDRKADFEVNDLLGAIRWLISYCENIETSKEFEAAVPGLMAEYMKRFHEQIVQWGAKANVMAQRAQLEIDQGRYVSTYPNDLMALMDPQVRVAKALPKKFMGRVAQTCLGALRVIQDAYMRKVSLEWRQIAAKDDGLQHLCAMVNDNVILNERNDDFVADLCQGISDEEMVKLKEDMEALASGYVQIALLTTGTIAASIELTLHEANIHEKFFGPDWEEGTSEGMSTVVLTAADFFQDLEIWLPTYFFAKLVRAVLNRLVKMYVEALLSKAPKAAGEGGGGGVRGPFRNVQLANERIAEDVDTLVNFFTEEHMPTTGMVLGELCIQAGLRAPDTIRGETIVIGYINTVLSADSMDALPSSVCQAAIKALVGEFKSQGVEVITHILGMQRSWSGEEKTQREQFISRLAKTCGEWPAGDVSERFTLEGYSDSSGGKGSKKRDKGDKWKRVHTSLKKGHISVEEI